jgi:hypothetical protein
VTAAAAINSSRLYAYKIAFLPVGTYTVAFTCDTDDPTVDETAMTPSPIHFTTSPQAVMVTTNMTATANF